MARRRAVADAPIAADVLQGERDRLLRIDDLRERILTCGYWCFETIGVERTSVELLCDIASISRPSFYRYFDNKQRLLEHIIELESLKVRAEVRRKIGHHDDVEEMLVEALFLIARATNKNRYIRGFLFSIDTAARNMQPRGLHLGLQMEWWGPFVQRGVAAGRIARDLATESIVAWLNTGMIMLMLQEHDQRMPNVELRAYIRRFLIRPLMPQSADQAGALPVTAAGTLPEA